MVSYPGESTEYRVARNALLAREAELRRATEEVAEARRRLPPGGVVPRDYVFAAGSPDGPRQVRFGELFGAGKDTLAVYSFMFPRAPGEDLPCPSCSSFLDAFDGAARHIGQRVSVAVVARTALPRLLEHGDRRGWRHLHLLSSAGNTYNRDYHGETPDGTQQLPMLNVFRRTDGQIRHFWGSELMFAPTEPGQDPRHTDSIDPQWNLFDYCPGGRGTDWYPGFSYDQDQDTAPWYASGRS
ncbi:MAG TPA: DUF899 family protein [Pseudonocardia sp.]|jgi:predicted dithiol-disulfide oxidoreductase (DUF899 family)|nr:DUF899 family protein [Pseudonocardia sp.]